MTRRHRPRLGKERALKQARAIGAEVRLARLTLALASREVDRLAGVSDSTVRRIEAGDIGVQLDTLAAVTTAVGIDLVLRAYPGAGPTLRDSGQLALAHQLTGQAHAIWQPRLEVRAGDHQRSADLVLFGPDEILHVEIERMAADFQAQYRSASAKRQQLAAVHARPVRLILAVEDTRRNRDAVRPHLELIRRELPAGSRQILTALRDGQTLGTDGVLWVRRQPARARDVSRESSPDGAGGRGLRDLSSGDTHEVRRDAPLTRRAAR